MNVSIPTPMFKIGTKYMSGGRYPRECTVVDVLTTFNSAGKAVKQYYVATHVFMGQTVTEYDVPAVSIQRGNPK